MAVAEEPRAPVQRQVWFAIAAFRSLQLASSEQRAGVRQLASPIATRSGLRNRRLRVRTWFAFAIFLSRYFSFFFFVFVSPLSY